MRANLRFDGVEYEYAKGGWKLQPIDLEVSGGELTAILGPNGSGKTTLINIALGLLEAKGGSARVLDVDPWSEWSTIARDVRYVPQTTNFEPVLTVEETVRWMGDYHGATFGEVEAALRQVDLADVSRNKISQLSGGQQRRVDIAITLLGQPRLVVLDEPSANLDVEFRAVVHEAIRSIRNRGAAVVLTTHDLTEAAELADHVVLLGAGEVLSHGSVEEVIASQNLKTTVMFEVVGPASVDVAFDGTTQTFSPQDGPYRREVSDGSAFTTALLAAAAASGAEIGALEVRPPKLQDAYLKTTYDTMKEGD